MRPIAIKRSRPMTRLPFGQAVSPRKSRITSALARASFFSEQGNAHPAPVRRTSVVLQTSTPDARSTAASTVTSVMSESEACEGFNSEQKLALQGRHSGVPAKRQSRAAPL